MEEKQAVELFLRTRTEEAFCQLFGPVYARVRRYFLLRSLDLATAEELAQNVMLRLASARFAAVSVGSADVVCAPAGNLNSLLSSKPEVNLCSR